MNSQVITQTFMTLSMAGSKDESSFKKLSEIVMRRIDQFEKKQLNLILESVPIESPVFTEFRIKLNDKLI